RRTDEVGGASGQRSARAASGEGVAGSAGRGNGRTRAEASNDPEQGRAPGHAAWRSAVAVIGESVYASVHRGMEAVGSRGAAGRSHCQLRRRLRDLHAGQRRGGDVHDACDDGEVEVDGERKEDAAESLAGGYVHVSGVYVRASKFAANRRDLCRSAAGREEDSQAVQRNQRHDGSANVSAGSLGASGLSQSEVNRLGELLLSGTRGPGLRGGDATRASLAVCQT